MKYSMAILSIQLIKEGCSQFLEKENAQILVNHLED